MVLLVLLGGCNGCLPKPPYPNNPDDPRLDTSELREDSGDTDTSGGDSALPPRCDFQETEPNNSLEAIEVVPMEQWICGDFSAYLDLDWFEITTNQAGWMKIQVEAALRGSSANPQVQLSGFDDDAVVFDGYLTTDPLLVFPFDEAGTFQLTLAETNLLYGEDYSWYMLTTLAKPPVEWDTEEVEPNDEAAEATPITIGQTAFGTIEASGDFDVYTFSTTSEGEQTLIFDVTGFTEGSPADLMLVLYDSDGVTHLKTKYSGEIAYDHDPYFQKKITGLKDLYLLVRTEDDKGSRFHWYTVSVTEAATGE